jgi:hypothetical protein
MTSAAKLAANRANAQRSTGPRTPEGKLRAAQNARKSTGPRTAAGKARAAQNARRHGLTLPACGDGEAAHDIAAAAAALAGTADDALAQAMARRLAMAQLNLLGVRRVRRDLLAAVIGSGKDTARLAGLEKYERRTRSRRKFAMRALAAALRRQSASGTFFSERTKPKPDAT